MDPRGRNYLVVLIVVLGILAALIYLLIPKVEYRPLPPKITEEKIDYQTQRIPNPEMYEGEENIVQEGKEGKKIITRYFVQKYVNREPQGPPQEVVSKRKVEVVEEPVDEIIEYGTKKGGPTGNVWTIEKSWDLFPDLLYEKNEKKKVDLVLEIKILNITTETTELAKGTPMAREISGWVIEYEATIRKLTLNGKTLPISGIIDPNPYFVLYINGRPAPFEYYKLSPLEEKEIKIYYNKPTKFKILYGFYEGFSGASSVPSLKTDFLILKIQSIKFKGKFFNVGGWAENIMLNIDEEKPLDYFWKGAIVNNDM